jgi:Tol biopolymer transport system component
MTLALMLAAVTAAGCGGGGGGGGGGDQADSSAEQADGDGAAGAPSTVVNATTTIDPGSECAAGGIRVESGIDENGNGDLDAAEVDASEVVCNGTDGADGADGSDGAQGTDALVELETIGAGAACAFGGTRILSGPDADGDGVLDAGEVADTSVLCADRLASFDGLLFFADMTLPGLDELWRVGPRGGPVKLDAPEEMSGEIVGFQPSPNGRYVAYTMTGTSSSDTPYRLYVADLTNDEPPVDATGTLVDGGSVRQFFFEWAPDSSRVAYVADQETDQEFDLYTVAPDGTGRERVSGAVAGDVQGFDWSPDATVLAYRITDAGTDTLWTSAVESPIPEQVNSGGTVKEWRWRPDSARLAYVADQDTADEFELYTANPDGSLPSKVSGTMEATGSDVLDFAWSPDGTAIAYRADQRADTRNELFVTEPGSGNAPVRVNDALPSGGDVSFEYTWSPGGDWLAFIGDAETNGERELFAVRPDGTSLAKLNESLVSGGRVLEFDWAPDGSRVAYRGDVATDGRDELYTIAPDASGRVRINDSLPAGSDVFSWKWAPDASRIAYAADQQADGRLELYTATPAGGSRARVNADLASGEDVGSYDWSPNAARIAYGVGSALITAAPDGADRVDATASLAGTGSVGFLTWTP